MSKPEVFIIESLKFSDEKKGSFEGNILSQILKLARKNPIYFYIRTKKELISVLEKYGESDYRYLHFSCHGDFKNMFTTLDDISFNQLAKILIPYIYKKRIFISACEMVNSIFANKIIPPSNCISIIGPKEKIHFGDAALFWSSFYHLMFSIDPDKMTSKFVEEKINELAKTYRVKINYFTHEKNSPHKIISKCLPL